MNDDTSKENEVKGENSFRNILKGTSIFGGVQIFNILIAAIRLKFVAVILGPAGMGVAGLFNTASLTIQQFASLGLNLAVVKETGQSKDNKERLHEVIAAIRPLILMTAAIGAAICLLFPGILSRWTFGNGAYTREFLLLSAAVFFSIAGNALMSILQGLHAVKPLSKASLIGSTTGLLIGVPMYWLWGTKGIVPAMVALSLCTCGWYWISLTKNLKKDREYRLAKETASNRNEYPVKIIRRIVIMGLVLMSNDLFRNLGNFLINIFVRSQGGMDDVGFYQSCNTMTSQYSAIVFTAMAMDYLPRLSAASGNNARMCEVVNRQIEIVGLLIAPIACAVILLAPLVIELLQTEKFLTATPLLRLLALAVVVRALMYPLGYIVFAKDNRRLFFWMESVGANIMTLGLTCGGFALFGLNGLGYAAILDCLICLTVYIGVNRSLYGYSMAKSATGVTIMALGCGAVMTGVCFLTSGIWMWMSGGVLMAVVCAISAKGIIRRRRD